MGRIAHLFFWQRWQVDNEVDCAQNYEGRIARTMEKCTPDQQIVFQWCVFNDTWQQKLNINKEQIIRIPHSWLADELVCYWAFAELKNF